MSSIQLTATPPGQRATLDPELQALRKPLAELVHTLEAQEGWYGSVFLERRASTNFSANLKQTNVSDRVSQGVVLRIYDGYTLFEQATDDLELESLKQTALKLVQRVRGNKPGSGVQLRPYHPPSWEERRAQKLDPEITSQIPANVNALTPVHFGIRFQKTPKVSASETLDRLKHLVLKCLELAPKHGLKSEDVTFAMARQGFSQEESIFIDREVNISQSLYRIALTVITMSGAERTVSRIGGLGGLEAVEFSDADIGKLLEDLKSLKTAERLNPGKYRVLLSPVLTGVLAHEAFGHSQEGDTCARGRSRAWELHKIEEKVGNQHATILNNPAIFQNGTEDFAAWGSYFFDEEGWFAQEQVLLDEGTLKSPMTNLTSAIRLGVPRTANGKRESWASGVYTRQTNTYFSPGHNTYDELLAQIDDGFIATEAAGGMEDPKGMGIQVGIQFLKEVKNGKLTGRTFKGPAGGDIQMTGYVPDVLKSILGKSKIESTSERPDRARHPFNDAGGCGKYHKEFVYAGCGGTYVLLDQVILG